MGETIDLFVPLGDLDQPLAPQVERALGWSAGSAGELRVVRRSLDARKGRPLGGGLRIVGARGGAPAGRAAAQRGPWAGRGAGAEDAAAAAGALASGPAGPAGGRRRLGTGGD